MKMRTPTVITLKSTCPCTRKGVDLLWFLVVISAGECSGEGGDEAGSGTVEAFTRTQASFRPFKLIHR